MARGLYRVAAVLCCLFVAGCAAKLPKTTPLAAGETAQALRTWSRFLHAGHPGALDADYRLRWDVLGSKGGIDAVVQMKKPALLRFAANDPLGRALILVVSDGKEFTFVDNRTAEVFQGKTNSKFWRNYVPDSIKATDLFAYLGGFVDQDQVTRVEPALDEAGQGYWYVWLDREAVTHHVLLEGKQGLMVRHLLVDKNGDHVLDLRYSGLVGSGAAHEEDLHWPEKIEVTGEAVTGKIELQAEKIYAFSVRGTSAFRLTPPPHFLRELVQ